jgi:hypothetical protein
MENLVNSKLVALWIVSLSLAFGAGHYFSGPTSPHQPKRTPIDDSADNTRSWDVDSVLRDAATVSEADHSKLYDAEEKLQESKLLSLQEEDLFRIYAKDYSASFEESASAMLLIGSMDQAAVYQLLDKVFNQDGNTESSHLMMLLLARLVDINPLQAIEYAKSVQMDDRFKLPIHMAVMQRWAQNSPNDAVDWYLENSQDNTFSNYPIDPSANIVFAALAKSDLNAALDILQILDSDDIRLLAVSAIASTLNSESDYIDLVNFTNQFDNKRITENILSAWVRSDTNAALDWFDILDDSAYKMNARESIFGTYMFHSDSSQAADWYMQTRQTASAQETADKIVGKWKWNDHETALRWINRQTDIDRSKSTYELLVRAAYSNPDFAFEHLDSISDKQDKILTARAILSGYLAVSDDKAQQFLNSLPFSDEEKARVTPIGGG